MNLRPTPIGTIVALALAASPVVGACPRSDRTSAAVPVTVHANGVTVPFTLVPGRHTFRYRAAAPNAMRVPRYVVLSFRGAAGPSVTMIVRRTPRWALRVVHERELTQAAPTGACRRRGAVTTCWLRFAPIGATVDQDWWTVLVGTRAPRSLSGSISLRFAPAPSA